MKLHDNLFNWLQMKIVSDHRPHDIPAQQTVSFFSDMLAEDHGIDLQTIHYVKKDEIYHIFFSINGNDKSKTFDCFAAEKLWLDIQSEPRYGE